MNKKISVVINTFNAEKHLARVLESVKGFDEIVVCDMQSTDGTLAIARKHGCKIVTFPKGDCVSAEPARTFAIQSASNDWVLVVDADELVTPELSKYLYKRIEENDCPQGLYIPRKNYFMGQWKRYSYPDYVLRFFVKEGTVWPPYVHTFPAVKGRVEKIPAQRKELAFVHLANDTVKDRIAKTNLYTDNEAIKKKDRNFGAMALLYRPAFRFFKTFVLKGGFRMGVAGLIDACLSGVYQFVVVAKILEAKHSCSKTSKEAQNL